MANLFFELLSFGGTTSIRLFPMAHNVQRVRRLSVEDKVSG